MIDQKTLEKVKDILWWLSGVLEVCPHNISLNYEHTEALELIIKEGSRALEKPRRVKDADLD